MGWWQTGKVKIGKLERNLERSGEIRFVRRRRQVKRFEAHTQAAVVPCRRFAVRAQRGPRSDSAFLTNRRSGGEAAAEAEAGRH